MNTPAELAAAKRRITELEERLAKIEATFKTEEKPIAEEPTWGPTRAPDGTVAISPDAKSYEERQAEDRRERQAAFQAEQAYRSEGVPANYVGRWWKDVFGLVRDESGLVVTPSQMAKAHAEPLKAVRK